MTPSTAQLTPAMPAREAMAALDGQAQATFIADGAPVIVVYDDLARMTTMGLGELPIDAIALPADDPPPPDPQAAAPQTLDISRRLTAYFPAYVAAALYEMQSLLRKGELRAYVIGGNVRDLLLYQARLLDIQDVDLTIEGSAIGASQFIVAHSRNFSVEACYPDFGTVTLLYKNSLRFDLASTRLERYDACGALPQVVQRGAPLAQDMMRRDFTVNTLAMAVHDLGVITDYVGGMVDIESRTLRALRPASFFEDPSRILRAFKFLARLDFNLSPGTDRLLRQFLKYGDRAYHGGGERIKHELRKFCEAEETPVKQRWMRYFREQGCARLANMSAPDPMAGAEIDALDCYWRQYPTLRQTLGETALNPDFRWRLHLCFILGESAGSAFSQTAHRLGLTRPEREQIVHYRQLLDLGGLERVQESSSPYDVYATFHDRPLSSVVAAAVVQYDGRPDRLQTILRAVCAYRDKYAGQKPELNGDDLMDLGVAPGESVGEMLRELLKLRLTGRLKDRLSEVRHVKRRLGLESPGPDQALGMRDAQGSGDFESDDGEDEDGSE